MTIDDQDVIPPKPEPVYQHGWPDICPTCGAGWKVKSRTMGAANGQPHQGTCNNGHRWHENNLVPSLPGPGIYAKLQDAHQRRQAELTQMTYMVNLCNCQFPIVKYRNGHGHSEDCPFVLDKKARQ